MENDNAKREKIRILREMESAMLHYGISSSYVWEAIEIAENDPSVFELLLRWYNEEDDIERDCRMADVEERVDEIIRLEHGILA